MRPFNGKKKQNSKYTHNFSWCWLTHLTVEFPVRFLGRIPLPHQDASPWSKQASAESRVNTSVLQTAADNISWFTLSLSAASGARRWNEFFLFMHLLFIFL